MIASMNGEWDDGNAQTSLVAQASPIYTYIEMLHSCV